MQQFDDIVHGDRETLRKYFAYTGENTAREIKLPMVPARANNEAGYIKELRTAGFIVDYFKDEKSLCILYTHKKGSRTRE